MATKLLLHTGLRYSQRTASSFLKPKSTATHIQSATAITVDHDSDKRANFRSKIKRSKADTVKYGFDIMKNQVAACKEDVESKLQMDSVYYIEHGAREVVWKFDNEEEVKKWGVTVDDDHDGGNSQAEFILGANKKGVFRGYLNTAIPEDGKIKYGGYCNITSEPLMTYMQKPDARDWSDFTHLLIRCRGDGRNYQLVIQMNYIYDMNWDDTFQFILYTRGGPYWQVERIPFSKFFLVSRGRIQDRQEPTDLERVKSLGITLADDNKGPFQLEIDYIGLGYDKGHTEQSAYEMYDTPKWKLV